MVLSNVSDQELIDLYHSAKIELSIAEDQLHTIYTAYGVEYDERIDNAEEYERACKNNFNNIKDEMVRRGIAAMNDV